MMTRRQVIGSVEEFEKTSARKQYNNLVESDRDSQETLKQKYSHRKRTESNVSHLASQKDKIVTCLQDGGQKEKFQRKQQKEAATAAPVSAAFLAVKINDAEQRVVEGRERLMRSLEREQDKRNHLQDHFEDELNMVSEYQTSGRQSQRKLNMTKSSLHRKSGFLNKFKDTQRSQAKLANGNPCEEISLINCHETE